MEIFRLFIVRQIQHIPLDTGSPVVQCSLADPYIVLLTQEGQILMFTLRTESVGLGVRLVVGKPSISQVGHIYSTVCKLLVRKQVRIWGYLKTKSKYLIPTRDRIINPFFFWRVFSHSEFVPKKEEVYVH